MNTTLVNRCGSPSLRPVVVVAGVNLLVSLGFAIGSVVADPTPTAGYALVRATALLALLVSALVLRLGRRTLLTVAAVAAGVQALDAVVGAIAGDVSRTVGPVVLAVLTAGAVLAATRHAPAGDRPGAAAARP